MLSRLTQMLESMEEITRITPPGCRNATGTTGAAEILRPTLHIIRQNLRACNSLLVATLQRYVFEHFATDPRIFGVKANNH